MANAYGIEKAFRIATEQNKRLLHYNDTIISLHLFVQMDPQTDL